MYNPRHDVLKHLKLKYELRIAIPLVPFVFVQNIHTHNIGINSFTLAMIFMTFENRRTNVCICVAANILQNEKKTQQQQIVYTRKHFLCHV